MDAALSACATPSLIEFRDQSALKLSQQTNVSPLGQTQMLAARHFAWSFFTREVEVG